MSLSSFEIRKGELHGSELLLTVPKKLDTPEVFVSVYGENNDTYSIAVNGATNRINDLGKLSVVAALHEIKKVKGKINIHWPLGHSLMNRFRQFELDYLSLSRGKMTAE